MNADDFHALLHNRGYSIPELMIQHALSYPFLVKRVLAGLFDCSCGCTKEGALIQVIDRAHNGDYRTNCSRINLNGMREAYVYVK